MGTGPRTEPVERNYHEITPGRFYYTTKKCARCSAWLRESDPDLCEKCDMHEQERRWAALDASVPCSHTIPGTCDYC
jgi:hypothetical protein